MSPATITLLFLLFAIVMFVWEKIPLGVTSMIICVGLVVTGGLDWKTAFAGFIDSNVILLSGEHCLKQVWQIRLAEWLHILPRQRDSLSLRS